MPIHDMYNKLSPKERKLVDVSWTAVARIFTENEYKTANDDDAERLVEAIAVYFRASNPRPYLGPNDKSGRQLQTFLSATPAPRYEKWTAKDAKAARAEGWRLATIDGDPMQCIIQREDATRRFETDASAVTFVRRRAARSDLHARALTAHEVGSASR